MITFIQRGKELLRSAKIRPLVLAIGVLVLALLLYKIDWSTIRRYKCTDGKYALRFPLHYSLHVERVKVQGRNQYHPVKNIVELDVPGKPKPYLLLSYTKNLQSQPIDEFIANSSECDEITDGVGEKISVAGLDGRIFRNVSCNSGGETRVYAMKGNIGYNFVFKGKTIDENILSEVINNFSLLP